MMDFRKQIKDMQQRKRIGTWALGRRAGLKTSATLYRYLNGESDITAGNLEKVLDTLQDMPDREEKKEK